MQNSFDTWKIAENKVWTILTHSYVISRIPQFLAVAKTGSFTAGALRVNVDQPSVTKSILQLEEFLQVELFTRNRSGVQLTAEEHIFFNVA